MTEITDKYARFEAQARAMSESWLSLRTDYEELKLKYEALKGDFAVQTAQNKELVRANEQLELQLQDSQRREGEALHRVGWLEGHMHTTATAFHAAVTKPSNPDSGNPDSANSGGNNGQH